MLASFKTNTTHVVVPFCLIYKPVFSMVAPEKSKVLSPSPKRRTEIIVIFDTSAIMDR